MKRVAIITAVIFLTLALLAVAWELRAVVLVFVISLVITATLEAPIEQLTNRGISRRLSIFLVYLAVIGVLIILIGAIFMPLISELNFFIIDLTDQYNRFRFRLSLLTGTRVNLLVGMLPPTEEFGAGLQEGSAGIAMMRGVIGMTQNAGIIIGQFALALVLSIYWTVDRSRFERLWLSLLAPDHRARTRAVMYSLTSRVGAYIRSEFFQVFLAGALLTLGFWLFNVKYPFIAAMLAALAWVVPLLGGLIALLPVAAIGWLSGPWSMAIAIVYTVLVFVFMEFFIERKVFHGHRYWGVLVIFVMLALGNEFGLVGLIIAPPVAVAIQIMLDDLLASPASRRQKDQVSDLPALRARLAEIEVQMQEQAPEETQHLANMVERLRTLLDKSEEVVYTNPPDDKLDGRVDDRPDNQGKQTGTATKLSRVN